MTEPADVVGKVFAALSDPTRRDVIALLSEEDSATATELAARMPVSRQAVVKHLAALSEAGLVSAVRQGRDVRYRLTPRPMADAVWWMTDVGAAWDGRLLALRQLLRKRSGQR